MTDAPFEYNGAGGHSMQSAHKLQIMIPADHRIEILLPEDVPTGPAELILLTERPQSTERRQHEGMDVGRGWVADDFDAPLPEDLQRLFLGLE